MARVVQQRTNPPYLLIVMVFLFLVAAAVAVLQYIDKDKLQKDIVRLKEDKTRLATPSELQTYSALAEQASRENKTLVSALSRQIEDLREQVKTATASAEAAISGAQDAKSQVLAMRTARGEGESWSGLVEELQATERRIDSLLANIKRLEGELAQKDQQQLQIAQANTQKFEQFQAQLVKAQADVAEAGKSLTDAQTAYAAQIEQHKAELKQIQDDLNRNIAAKTRQITDLQAASSKQQREIDRLLAELRKKTAAGDAMDVARKPDGEIVKLSGQDLCYINIGSNQNVVNGMTFEVYPRTGIPKDGQGKGSLIVTRTLGDSSECKIIETSANDPIVANDLVANLAYDPNRTFSFVVEGSFDLYGSGQKTALGAEEVKTLIRRYGGKVTDEVTTQTDFIVMGEEPAQPQRPADSAEPSTWQVYNDQMKKYQQYTAIRNTAATMNIPVLNSSRFLAFMGYKPVETLTR